MNTTRFLVPPRPRGRRHLPRLCAAVLAAAALAGGARQAGATMTIGKVVERTDESQRRKSSQNPLWISHEDCVTNNGLVFSLDLGPISTSSSETLSVWASEGTDCTDPRNRQPNELCKSVDEWPITAATVDNNRMTIRLEAKKIAAAFGAGDCNDTRSGTGAVSMTLYFMRLAGLGLAPEESATWDQTKMDLKGPMPPTEVDVGSGDGRLLVTFPQNEDQDVQGYYLYCDDKPTSSPGAAGATGASGAAGTGGAASAAGAGGATGAGGGDDGEGGDGDDTADDGSSGCQSSVLTPGEIPDPALRPCGSVGRTGNAEAGNLTNGNTYVVAVAAYDIVGNAGELSELACGTPIDVDGFFELYREAGGQAGGGFCSVEGPVGAGQWVSWPLGALATGAALGLWRRSRRRRARSFTQENG